MDSRQRDNSRRKKPSVWHIQDSDTRRQDRDVRGNDSRKPAWMGGRPTLLEENPRGQAALAEGREGSKEGMGVRG